MDSLWIDLHYIDLWFCPPLSHNTTMPKEKFLTMRQALARALGYNNPNYDSARPFITMLQSAAPIVSGCASQLTVFDTTTRSMSIGDIARRISALARTIDCLADHCAEGSSAAEPTARRFVAIAGPNRSQADISC